MARYLIVLLLVGMLFSETSAMRINSKRLETSKIRSVIGNFTAGHGRSAASNGTYAEVDKAATGMDPELCILVYFVKTSGATNVFQQYEMMGTSGGLGAGLAPEIPETAIPDAHYKFLADVDEEEQARALQLSLDALDAASPDFAELKEARDNALKGGLRECLKRMEKTMPAEVVLREGEGQECRTSGAAGPSEKAGKYLRGPEALTREATCRKFASIFGDIKQKQQNFCVSVLDSDYTPTTQYAFKGTWDELAACVKNMRAADPTRHVRWDKDLGCRKSLTVKAQKNTVLAKIGFTTGKLSSSHPMCAAPTE